MDEWDKGYGAKYKESFFGSFMDDASPKQREKYGEKLYNTMQERAVKDGRNIHHTFLGDKPSVTMEQFHNAIQEMREKLYSLDPKKTFYMESDPIASASASAKATIKGTSQ